MMSGVMNGTTGSILIMKSTDEGFVYIWYDAKNKMYYIGKHQGSPNDSYTHSSTVMEKFNKNNIPEGFRRRIIFTGTNQEIAFVEHTFLKNRKKRCWSRYYNTGLGDPRYIDQSGPNNHMYGRKLTEEEKEEKRQISLRLWRTPIEEGGLKGYKQKPETIEKMRQTKKRKFASGELVPFMKGKKQSKETIAKVIASRAKLNDGAGFKHNQETKKKMSKARSGSGNANWKGGINSDPVHKATVRRERMKDPIKRKEYNKKHSDYMNKRKGWTEERYKQLFDLYKLNLSNDQIAEHMGITRQSVVSQLKNHFNLING
jgi:hypothetical protein